MWFLHTSFILWYTIYQYRKIFIYIVKLISVLLSSPASTARLYYVPASMTFHSNFYIIVCFRTYPVQMLLLYSCQAWIILSVRRDDTGDSGMWVVRLVLWIEHGGEEGWRRRAVVFVPCLLQEHPHSLAPLLPRYWSLCRPAYWWVRKQYCHHTITDYTFHL